MAIGHLNLSIVVAILLATVASCQEFDRQVWDELEGHPGRGLIRPMPPFPFPFSKCKPSTGGWAWTPVTLPQPNANTFYLGCKIRKPTYSKCNGGCSSGDSIDINRGTSTYNKHCKCCRSSRVQKTIAYPYCVVVNIATNGDVSYKWRYLTHIRNYTYYQVKSCGCYDCDNQFISSKFEGEVEKTAVAGPTNIVPPKENINLRSFVNKLGLGGRNIREELN